MFTRLKAWWYGELVTETFVATPASNTPLVAQLHHHQEEPVPPTDPAPSTDIDALGHFQKDLKETLERDNAELAWWKEQKRKLYGDEKKSQQNLSLDEQQPSANVSFKTKLQQIGRKIKISAEFAEMAVADLMAEVQPHVYALHKEMNELCHKLDAAIDGHAARHLEADICDINISILNSFISLHDCILDEIQYCLNFEKKLEAGSEMATQFLMQFLVTLITKGISIPVPEIKFDLSERYRVCLNHRLEGNKVKLETFETHIEKVMNKAKHLILAKYPDLSSVTDNSSTLFLTSVAKTAKALKPAEELQIAPGVKFNS